MGHPVVNTGVVSQYKIPGKGNEGHCGQRGQIAAAPLKTIPSPNDQTAQKHQQRQEKKQPGSIAINAQVFQQHLAERQAAAAFRGGRLRARAVLCSFHCIGQNILAGNQCADKPFAAPHSGITHAPGKS